VTTEDEANGMMPMERLAVCSEKGVRRNGFEVSISCFARFYPVPNDFSVLFSSEIHYRVDEMIHKERSRIDYLSIYLQRKANALCFDNMR
jgi:hypothetical protein